MSVVVAVAALLSMLFCGAAGRASAQPPTPLAERLAAVRARFDAGAFAEAAPAAERLQADADAAGEPLVAALAGRTLGSIRLEQDRFADARTVLVAARDRFRAIGERRYELETDILLARVLLYEGKGPAALEQATPALAELERLGLSREAMAAVYDQVSPLFRRGPRHDELMRKALALLKPGDRFPVACSIWQSEGDRRFNAADYVAAHESLTEALACFEGIGRRADAGRVLVSLGRVQRAHGQLQNALANYVRAAAMQKADGDIAAWLQSINAQAVTYDRLFQPAKAEALYREALAVARAEKLTRYETFLQGNLGGSLLLFGKTRAALAELLAVLPLEHTIEVKAIRHRQVAIAYRELGELTKALEHVDLARRVGGTPVFDEDVALHNLRGTLLAMQGDLDGAQQELDAGIALVEDARARALASDSARRGFGDLHQEIFAGTIDLAMRRQQGPLALELAEQARARALLDLVNARGAETVALPPPKVADMQALARTLDTTLLVYWVGQSSTFAWVVTPASVKAHRLPVGERRLRALVRTAAGAGDVAGTINAALLGTPDLSAWRALHRALVTPLRGSLPTTPAARLTVVPHGPLLHLPFAGLLDSTGRYLVERYVIHYAPSVAVLQAAARQAGDAATPVAAASPSGGRALVLGDPAPLPRLPGVQLPPPLPLAREEARAVARHFPQGAMLSIGGAATERLVRTQLADYRWLHVATHARVAEEATAPSYLLLARGQGGADDDGLLTAEEVKALPLEGTTVVLSACGTALGRVSGEGTLGFTRSFLAAGAR
ncbi:MAG TPA: CHAT domain-containing protein, partial [Luteitalea sp.]|nr:CHAT domain-containing protein [Luteitalea sp.]